MIRRGVALTACARRASASYGYTHKTFVPILAQTRNVHLSEFMQEFRKKLQKNIKENPEFGGGLKRLQQTSETISEKTTSNFSQAFETAGKQYETSVEWTKRNIADPLEKSEAVKHTVEKLKSTGGIVVQVFDTIVDNLVIPVENLFLRTSIGQNISVILSPKNPEIPADVYTLKAQGIRPHRLRRTVRQPGDMELTIRQESVWERVSSSLSSQRDDDWEEDDLKGRLADNVGSKIQTVKYFSVSPLAKLQMKIRTELNEPHFEITVLRRWVLKNLLPAAVEGTTDPVIAAHLSKPILTRLAEKDSTFLLTRIGEVETIIPDKVLGFIMMAMAHLYDPRTHKLFVSQITFSVVYDAEVKMWKMSECYLGAKAGVLF